jgi:hypothetical protein
MLAMLVTALGLLVPSVRADSVDLQFPGELPAPRERQPLALPERLLGKQPDGYPGSGYPVGTGWLLLPEGGFGAAVLLDREGIPQWRERDDHYWSVIELGRDLTGDGVPDLHLSASTGWKCCASHVVIDGADPERRYAMAQDDGEMQRFRVAAGELPTLWVQVTVTHQVGDTLIGDLRFWLPYQIRDRKPRVAVHLMPRTPTADHDLSKIREALDDLATPEGRRAGGDALLAPLTQLIGDRLFAARGQEVTGLLHQLWPKQLKGLAQYRCALLADFSVARTALEQAHGRTLEALLDIRGRCPKVEIGA